MGSASTNRGIEGIAGDIDKAIYSTEVRLKPLSEYLYFPFVAVFTD